MKRIALYLGLATALATSCSIQEEDFKTPQQNEVTYNASFEQPTEEGTRVYANEDLLLRWTADDRVSIFEKNTYNQQFRFTGETGDNAGGFKKVAGDDYYTGNSIPNVVSVYPYLETTKISENGVLTVDLPAEQHYAENTFGLGANTMVSVTSDNFLQYKNVGGYLMISLYGEGVSVSSITLKGNNGEKLAGKASITMPLDGVPTAVMSNDATSQITLRCVTPVQLGTTAEESIHFWFVVPPVTFSNGFTISVKDDRNGVFEKTTTKELTISRNALSKMTAIKAEIQSQEIHQPLTLEAIENGTVSFDNPLGLTIEYSVNGIEWISTTTTVTIDLKAGEQVLFRGNNESYSIDPLIDSYKYSLIQCSSPCYIYGNIMSLIRSDSFSVLYEITANAAFYNLFFGNNNIYNHPEKDLLLPATALTDYCYSRMFQGCTNLTVAPKLPATTLAKYCYQGMFTKCSSLQDCPVLPARVLAEGCYYGMFSECTSLERASALPATEVTAHCYREMFSDCTSLKVAPDLPATTLASSCYQSMFWNCTSLVSAPSILPATDLALYCYKRMFRGCTSLTIAPVLPAEILQSYCYEEMFIDCTSLNYIKAMFLSFTKMATSKWVENVAETGTFVQNEKATWDSRGVNAIPEGWEVLKEESSSSIKVITYMTHSKGSKAVPLVILPDGFLEEELPTFRTRAIEGIETLFSVEPFKTYRDYFSVYIIEVPSAESGISITDGQGNITAHINSYFETRWGASSYSDMRANDVKVRTVASMCPDVTNGDHYIWDVPIALLANDTRYGGICISESNGNAYCIIPFSYSGETIGWSYPVSEATNNVDDSQGYRTVSTSDISEMGVCYGDWKNIFVHEFGGHAFGRFADEYWYGNSSASSPYIIGHSFSAPFGLNLSGSYDSVPWQELLDNQQRLISMDSNYGRIGIYQGGDVCMFGRWRNERISCMIDNRFYFSAWQRYLISKRIMTISGDLDSFSFESWLAQDKTDDPIRDNHSSTIRNYTPGVVHQEKPLHPPVIIER